MHIILCIIMWVPTTGSKNSRVQGEYCCIRTESVKMTPFVRATPLRTKNSYLLSVCRHFRIVKNPANASTKQVTVRIG